MLTKFRTWASFSGIIWNNIGEQRQKIGPNRVTGLPCSAELIKDLKKTVAGLSQDLQQSKAGRLRPFYKERTPQAAVCMGLSGIVS